MKIAMILRPDADRVFGGDTVVMEKSAAALRRLGAEVVVARQADIGPAQGFDVLHLIGLAPPEHVSAMVAWARSSAMAIVCSPLYWNDFRDWYERAVVTVPRWRLLARVLGKRRTWPVYRGFQAARTPRDRGWQVGRAGLLAADIIATTSRWENAWLAEHFRLPEPMRRSMGLVRFGIDEALYGQSFSGPELAQFRARHGLPPGYVAQVGRIEEKKNQLAVIEALYDDPIPLVFVGKDSPYYRPDYPERCRKLGAARGAVCFIEWLPEAELPLLYAAAAAHILPSWVELPGLTSLEAGACGTRVISTGISPLPELLGDRADYCDPYDRRSIRQAVLASLARPAPADLRPRLLTEFSWGEAARVNLALYEEGLRLRTSRAQ